MEGILQLDTKRAKTFLESKKDSGNSEDIKILCISHFEDIISMIRKAKSLGITKIDISKMDDDFEVILEKD